MVYKNKLKMACRLKYRDFPGSLVCGNLQCSAGDMDSIPGQKTEILYESESVSHSIVSDSLRFHGL